MAVCNALVRSDRDERERHDWPPCVYSSQEAALNMAKKYAVLRLKSPKPEGGYLETFELGMADLGAWGDEYFDASGYPYPDEVHAFVHDWVQLGGDFQLAMQKIDRVAREHNSRIAGTEGDVQETREPAAPAKK
jgi:hypothetical protein